MAEDIESKILDFLEKKEFGASAVEISNAIDVSRPTLLKYLEVMRLKGLVDFKNAGMTKLWHSHKPHILELLAREEESNYRLKTILDIIGAGVAILDKDKKFLYINERYKKQIRNQKGYLPKIKGRSCEEIFRKDKIFFPDYYAVIETLKTGGTEIREGSYKDFNGNFHYYEVQCSVIKDKKGDVIGVLLLRRSITEKRMLENALKSSEERYKEIFNNVNVGIYRVTPGIDGRHIDVNPAYVKIFNYKSKDEALNTFVRDTYVDIKEKEEFESIMKEKGFVKNWEARYKRKDGSIVIVRETASAVRDENGNIKYYDGIIEDITEIRELEKKLEETRSRYKEIFENVNVGIYRTTPGKNGKVIEANSYLLKMFGFKDKEEISKINVADYYKNPKDREIFEKKIAEKGYIKNEEFEYKRKDGTSFWVRETAIAVRDENGNIRYYDGMFDDITEIKELERALKESEERYRTIFENVNAGVNRVTPGEKGRFIDVNSAFVRMLGYTNKEELLKLNVCDIYQNPKDRKKFNEKILKQGYLKDEILKIKKKDGTPIIVRENAVVVYDENGKPKYFDCITEDITEKKRLEDALKESEERYRTIFDNSYVAITFADKNERIIYWNKYTEDLLSMNREQLYLKPVRSLYPIEEWKKIRAQNLRKKGIRHRMQTKMINGNGKLIDVVLSISVLRDSKGNVTGSIGIFRELLEKEKK
ncbi:MAG: PAS domain S-box protein [Candidatus Altiarchaeota archaeon]